MARQRKQRIPEPRQKFGAGYLYHYHTLYQDFTARFEAIGGSAESTRCWECSSIQSLMQSKVCRIARQARDACTRSNWSGQRLKAVAKTVDRIQELARRSRARISANTSA